MKTMLLFSGGLDSTTLLYNLRASGEVECVGFNYGQRHSKEIDSARRICKDLGVRYDVVDLSPIGQLLGSNSLTSQQTEVPEGHYEDQSMRLTVVPNRNMILLSIASGIAIARAVNAVAYAAHSGDHAIYPDCRPEFTAAMREALGLCDWSAVALLTPFIEFSKADIVRQGSALGVPFEKTWSCYKGGEVHCGKCGTCTERIEAFRLAGVEDPTPYEVGAP